MTKLLARKSNGYGSSYAEVLIKIKRPLDKILIDNGWSVHTSSSQDVIFKYVCKNYYRGDDESIVNSLCRDLPEGVDIGMVNIDWSNSAF